MIQVNANIFKDWLFYVYRLEKSLEGNKSTDKETCIQTNVIPIHKSGNTADPINCMPTSVLFVSSKSLEKQKK